MSKENILNKIRRNKPSLKEILGINENNFCEKINLAEAFTKNSEAAGGKVIFASGMSEAVSIVKSLLKDFEHAISLADKFDFGTIALDEEISAKALEKLEAAVLTGQFGVAENGAVWITDYGLPHRIIPFITQHLYLILNEKEIVENMHEAYDRLSLNDFGYGVFISGPSKTADIEQSLVIGAQGPLSMTVILFRE